MSEEELDNVAGGSAIETIEKAFGKTWDMLFDSYDKVTPAKYSCPKCGSWDVDNIDIGFMYEMRVICHQCGFRGCKDGGKW